MEFEFRKDFISGDAVIKTVVNKISELIRSSDILIRFGGEEFIILFQIHLKNKLLLF